MWAMRVGEAQRVFVDVRVGEGLIVPVFCDIVIEQCAECGCVDAVQCGNVRGVFDRRELVHQVFVPGVCACVFDPPPPTGLGGPVPLVRARVGEVGGGVMAGSIGRGPCVVNNAERFALERVVNGCVVSGTLKDEDGLYPLPQGAQGVLPFLVRACDPVCQAAAFPVGLWVD